MLLKHPVPVKMLFIPVISDWPKDRGHVSFAQSESPRVSTLSLGLAKEEAGDRKRKG